VIISLEVLIPVSLYISVVLAFGRFTAILNHAMFALGVTAGQGHGHRGNACGIAGQSSLHIVAVGPAMAYQASMS